MTLTLNKGFWGPAGGGGNNPDFADVQFLTTFDTDLPTDLSNNSTSVSSARYSRETSTTMFSSAGAYEGTGNTGSGASSYSNYYLEINTTTDFISAGTAPRTIECFFYCPNTPSWGIMWGNFNFAGAGSGIYFATDASDKVYLTVRGTTEISLTASGVISSGNWYYAMVALSGTGVSSPEISVYLGLASASTASQVLNTSYSMSVPNGAKSFVGAGHISTRPAGGWFSGFDGYVDELRVSEVDLSSEHASTVPVPTSLFPTS